MKITWKDIKDTVYNMMFLDVSEYAEYSLQIITSVNYALIELSKNFAQKKVLIISQPLTDEVGYNEYDLKELTKDGDSYRFLGFNGEAPILKNTDCGKTAVMDFNIINDRYLYLNKQDTGEFVITYKVYPTQITETTSDDFEIDLAPEVANLIPLIMAWRIFIDDDITRATMYFNEYDSAKNELLARRGFASGVVIQGGEII